MQTIGRYQILDRVGSGGMAEVFVGRTTGDGGFEKLVAIKRILRHLASHESFVRMFIDEARISATLSHANIAQIFEFGKADDTYYIAMEHILGLSLVQVLRHFRKRREVPPAGLAAYVMMCVCAALEHAHSKRDDSGKPLGIVHRDVSPSNVMLSFEGEVKLIDFGIVKAARRVQQTVGRHIKGKCAYMSPEQAVGGRQVDGRSDIFCVGIMLVELLSGKNPFRGDSDMATLERVRYAQVPPPPARLRGATLDLYRVAARALARQPDDRYATAGAMLEQLEAMCQQEGFASRQLASWLGATFPDEARRLHETLRQARERADAELREAAARLEARRAAAEDASDELDDEELPTLELLSKMRLESEERRAPSPVPPPLPPQAAVGPSTDEQPTLIVNDRPAIPAPGSHPVAEQPHGPPAPRVAEQPHGPPAPSMRVAEQLHGPPAPSTRVAAPLQPAEAPQRPGHRRPERKDPSVRVAIPLLAAPATPEPLPRPSAWPPRRQPRRGQRASAWSHAILFAAFTAVLAAAIYLLAHREGPPPVGSIAVHVLPAREGRLFVDGKLHGPLSGSVMATTVTGLEVGQHLVRVDSAGFGSVRAMVDVVGGETTPVYLTLQRQQPGDRR